MFTGITNLYSGSVPTFANVFPLLYSSHFQQISDGLNPNKISIKNFNSIDRFDYSKLSIPFKTLITKTHNLKEAEIRQPWVVNGHNAHTPDSREACQAIAFYDNFTPEKSRPIKIEPLSIT